MSTHRQSGIPEYGVWTVMKMRCLNPNDKAYKNYGGRGITVCARWLYFEEFISDMGHRPSPELTLERIDNDGNYEPGNCKWGTRTEQGRNTRRIKLTIDKAREIRELYKNGSYSHSTLARHFNVSKSEISKVMHNYNWKEPLSDAELIFATTKPRMKDLFA